MKTVRLTTAQAIVRYLMAQQIEIDAKYSVYLDRQAADVAAVFALVPRAAFLGHRDSTPPAATDARGKARDTLVS